MAMRPFQTDVPPRAPLGRVANIRARVNANIYVLDLGPGSESTVDLGLYSGPTLLRVGEPCWASWSDEAGAWLIRMVNTQSFTSQVVYRPLASDDDGWWRDPDFGAPTFNSTNNALLMTDDASGGGDVFHTFIRFPAIELEQGVSLEPESVRFWASKFFFDDEDPGPGVTIFANAIDDAVAPTTMAAAKLLDLTTASAAWNDPLPVIGDAGIADTIATTATVEVDLTAVVQEIIDRPGWVTGNALMLMLKTTAAGGTSNDKSIASFDYGTLPPPALVIAASSGNEPAEGVGAAQSSIIPPAVI